jgi:thioesterase domain-containing protein
MGVHLFEDIARALPSDQPLMAIHIPALYIPGFDPFPSIVSLAEEDVAAIRQHQAHGPYFLLGLCHGGVVAFEIACQLEALGERVGVVGMLDAELPSAGHSKPGARLVNLVERFFNNPQDIGRRAMELLGRSFGDPKLPPLRQRQDTLTGEPVEMPFDGPEIEHELETYDTLDRRTAAHVVAFRATKNDLPPWMTIEPHMGWKGRAGQLTCVDIPSSHLGIVRGTAGSQVAAHLDAAKRKAERQSS